jgi:predicted dehydrogenase
MYNVGIIGCGRRFREVYLNVINKLQKNKKIKIQKINSFNSDIRDIRKKLNCEIETNIDLIIKDKVVI